MLNNNKQFLGRERSMNVIDELQSELHNYFEQHPHMSINALALKSGVGATTIRRFKSKTIKGDPAPHTVLNILSAMTNEKSLIKLIKMHNGKIGDLLKGTFGPYVDNSMDHTYDTDLNWELKDGIKYFIYKMAANRSGITSMWVGQVFGKLGLERLRELEDSGVIYYENKNYHAKEKNFSMDVFTAAKHLPELVRFYKPEQIEKGRNIFYTLSESINEEGIQKIKAIQKEAVNKIYQILNANEFHGDIPFFTLNLSDTLEAEEIGELQ
jgi:hypothetical protein